MFIQIRKVVPFSIGSIVEFIPKLRSKFDSMDMTSDPIEFSSNYNNRNLKLMYVIDDKALGTELLTRVIPIIAGNRMHVQQVRGFSKSKTTFLYHRDALVRFTGNIIDVMDNEVDSSTKERKLKIISNLIMNNYKVNINV